MKSLDPELVAWIHRARAGKAARFTLRQHVAGVGDQPVTTYDASAYPVDRDLAAEVWTRGQRDAGAFPGVTTYFLCAVREGEEVYFDRFPFRLAGTPLDGMRPSEEPNAIGLTAQAMRHLEAMALQQSEAVGESLDALKAIIGIQNTTIKQQGETIVRLSAQQLDVLTLREKLLSEDHVRLLETKRSDAEEKRQEWAVQQLAGLLPFIKARMMAPPGTPNGKRNGAAAAAPPDAPSPEVARAKAEVLEQVNALVLSLQANPDVAAKIWDVIGPEQKDVLGKLFAAANAHAGAVAEAEARGKAAHANGATS